MTADTKVESIYFRELKCGPLGNLRKALREVGIATSQVLDISYIGRSLVELIVTENVRDRTVKAMVELGCRQMQDNPITGYRPPTDTIQLERVRAAYQKRTDKVLARLPDGPMRKNLAGHRAQVMAEGGLPN